MTKEEAIERLKNMAWLYGSVEREQNIEAINLAIESLSAEYEDYEHATLVDIKEPLKVAVVRCKDCKHRNNGGWCDVYLQPRMETDFCNHGERKEE